MSTTITCPKCGAVIPPSSPDARCPRCMLNAGVAEDTENRPSRFEGDRNLLFGVFAVQLRKVSPQEIMAAAGAWAADASKDIPTRLRDQGILSQVDVEFITRLVDEAVRAHGGDTTATLNTLGGGQILQATYGNSIDLTVHRYGGAAGSPVYLDTSALDPDSVPAVQETPGRYTHVSEYGRGGMGRVLLVHDGFLGRNVALKELMPGSRPTSDPDNPSTPVRQYMAFLSRFLQEARITGQLEHPSIVPVYELGHRKDGTLYYTMKLVRGKTLREAINRCKTLQDRLALLAHFVDLCQAIAYAHSRGIIHRDIKPDNVMVGEFGETVVLDWGLAKAKDREDVHADGLAETIRMLHLGNVESALKTQYGQVMGTPGYMAPEQALGQMSEVDERSDVYSLGAVLYQVLTGNPPFTGKSVQEILQQVVDDEPQPLDTKTTPPELAAICMKALSKRADNRYTSAAEMAAEVRRFQTGAIVQAYTYGLSHHLKRFANRHKAVLATSVAALFALIALAGYSYINIRQARDVAESARDAAKLNLENAQSKGARISVQWAESMLTRDGEMDAARAVLWDVLPEQRTWDWGRVLNDAYPSMFTWPLDDHGKPAPWGIATQPNKKGLLIWSATDPGTIWNWHDATRVPLQNPGPIDVAAFNLESTRVVTASREGHVQLWDVATGQRLKDIGGGLVANSLIDMFPLTRVVTKDNAGQLQFFDAFTGERISASQNAVGTLSGTIVSNDGATFAALTGDTSAVLWNTKTGAQIATLTVDAGTISRLTFSPTGQQIATETPAQEKIQLWNTSSGERLAEYDGYRDVRNPEPLFTPDGSSVLINKQSAHASLIDVSTGKELATLYTGRDTIRITEFSVDSKYLLTVAENDRIAHIFDTATGKETAQLQGLERPPVLARFSLDGSRIFLAAENGAAGVWNTATGTKQSDIRYLPNADSVEESDQELLLTIKDARFTPDGALVFALLDSEQVIVFAVDSGRIIARPRVPSLSEIWFSPDGYRFITRIDDYLSYGLYDMTTGKVIAKLDDNISDVAYTSDGKSFVTTVSNVGQPKIRDAATGAAIASLDFENTQSNAVTFSHDNRLIAIGGEDNVVIYDARSLKPVQTISGVGPVSDLEFNNDATRLLIDPREHQIFLANVLNGEIIAERKTLTETEDSGYWADNYYFPHLAFESQSKRMCGNGEFSPDGRYVTIKITDGTMFVLDADSGQEILKQQGYKLATFSPGGSKIAFDQEDGSTEVYDLNNHTPAIQGVSSDAGFFRYSPDWEKAVSLISHRSARVVGLGSGGEPKLLPGYKIAAINAIGSQAILGRIGGPWELWNTKQWTKAHSLTNSYFDSIGKRDRAFFFTGDGRYVIAPELHFARSTPDENSSGGAEPSWTKISLWSVDTGGYTPVTHWSKWYNFWQSASPLFGRYASIRSGWDVWDDDNGISYVWDTKRNRELFSGQDKESPALMSDSNLGLILDQTTNQLGEVISSGYSQGHTERIFAWTYRNNGMVVLRDAFDGTVSAIDLSKNQIFPGFRVDEILQAAFVPNSMIVATGTKKGEVTVWDAEAARALAHLKSQTAAVTSLRFGNDGKHVVSGYANGSTVIADANSGKEIKTFGSAGSIVDAQMANDGASIAIISPSSANGDTFDFALMPVNGSSTAPLVELLGFSRDLSYAFTNDGKRVAVGFVDGQISVFDAHTGATIGEFPGEGSAIRKLDYNPDNTRMVLSAENGAVFILDARDGKKLVQLEEGKTRNMRNAVFSPDGTMVVTCFGQSTICVWRAADGQQLASLPCDLDQGDWMGEKMNFWNDSQHAEFSPDNQSVIAVSTPSSDMKNTILRWRAAPWRLEDLPGEGDDWQERFRLWKLNEFARLTRNPQPSAN